MNGGRSVLVLIYKKIPLESMDCNFSGNVQRAETTLRIKAQEIRQRYSYVYLGSIISKDGEIEEDVEHRKRARWLKWRLASKVLCDRCISTKLKENFYMMTIRSAMMTYKVECWPIKEQHMNKNECSKDKNVR